MQRLKDWWDSLLWELGFGWEPELPAADDPKLSPILSIEVMIQCDCRDWANDPGDAWLYGIVVGWGTTEDWQGIAHRHHWTECELIQLKRLHKQWQKYK